MQTNINTVVHKTVMNRCIKHRPREVLKSGGVNGEHIKLEPIMGKAPSEAWGQTVIRGSEVP